MNFYIPYQEKTKDIKLLYLLYLYGIAEYNTETKLYDSINYKSFKEIKDRINNRFKSANISQSTIERFIKALSSESYNNYLSIDLDKKRIILNNNFKKQKKVSFVVIDSNKLDLLANSKDDLLCKYYFYFLYNCGKSRTHTTDSTAEQILKTMGYSSQSGNIKTKLSEYNSKLKKSSLLLIRTYTDERGYKRNEYRIG